MLLERGYVPELEHVHDPVAAPDRPLSAVRLGSLELVPVHRDIRRREVGLNHAHLPR